ncbi:ParB/RepB/Spo0J family partition protein [Cellulomonas oligotrophica]|uniref:ParB family chromosome partitioning protein n=1 Tax=Cellulomonas oligotrophica TaxID=931536 RepID=A0A7Y9JYE2_9CELL|nr:ParB/RepB/Spo0J family partition protein [Cellulomonas oligotrophica]NYD86642.1 ParB family chromosome partitioning protein [Cellulomonas oligotrophica]GIG34379.1 hypothetical protein Col01nite_35380 [Cellulomonas oligotrophica]
MSEKRRGLGRGLGALIPTGLDGSRSTGADRPVDVFFPDNRKAAAAAQAAQEQAAVEATEPSADAAASTDGNAGQVTPGGAAPDETTPDRAQETSPDHGAESRAGTAESGPVAADDDVTAAADRVADVDQARHGGAADGTEHPDAASGTAAATVEAARATDGAAVSSQVSGSAEGTVSTGDDGHVAAPASDDWKADVADLVPVPGARFAELPVDAIRANARQPRQVFDDDALEELVGSIRELGVLQPIVVRDVGDGYELIMGERRWRATQQAGLETIPAIIRETDDADMLRDALLENLHRAQLNPLEEAAAYQQLLDDFGCTHDELATRIHRSRPQISNTLRLLRLPPLVQRRVAAGVISAGHARALLGLSDGAAIERLAQRIVAEGLSVRAVEEIVALGGDETAPTRRPRPRAGVRNEALDELAGRLSDRFETRVKVDLGKTRGRLTVEFASVQDLNRILNTLAPDDPGLLRG